MPAGDFTASVLPDILMQVEDIFARPTAIQCEFEHPVMTAKLMLERQEVRTVPVLEGTVCKGVKAWFLQSGTDSIVHDGTAERTTANCDIATGTQLQTNSKTYDNNISIQAVHEVEDARCDNAVTFQRESAMAIIKAMVDIRKRLNTRCLALLNANVQPHQYTNIDATYIGGNYSLNANSYKVAPTNFNQDTLQYLRLVAHHEQVKDPIILNVGSNFFMDKDIAFFKRVTTTENYKNEIYNAADIHWDLDGYDSLATPRNTTFIFSPNVVLFWNTIIHNTNVPIQIDSSKNLWVYKIQDPELMYKKDGRLVPVEYDVRYQFTCNGLTNLGQEKFVHKYEVTLRGGLDIAPSGFNRAATPVAELTGVTEFVAEV